MDRSPNRRPGTERPTAWRPSARALAALAGACLVALGLAGCREHETRSFEDRRLSVLPLAPQTTLRIETGRADVEIQPSPDDSVHLEFYRNIRSFSARSV